jgi:hypothetical protein
MPCSFRARREERGCVVTYYRKAGLVHAVKTESNAEFSTRAPGVDSCRLLPFED